MNNARVSTSGMTYKSSNISTASSSIKRKNISCKASGTRPSTVPIDNKENFNKPVTIYRASNTSNTLTDNKKKNISTLSMAYKTSNISTAPIDNNKKDTSTSGITLKASNTSTALTDKKKKTIPTSTMARNTSNISNNNKNTSASGMTLKASNTSTASTVNNRKNILLSGITPRASFNRTAPLVNKRRSSLMSGMSSTASNTSTGSTNKRKINKSTSGMPYKASNTSRAPTDKKNTILMSKMACKASNTRIIPIDKKDNIPISEMIYKASNTSIATNDNRKKNVSASFIRTKSKRPIKPDIVNKPSVLTSKWPGKEKNSVKTGVKTKVGSSQQTEVSSCVSWKAITEDLLCVAGQSHLSGIAQEPWPKDVKLYQPYEVEQILLPDNANCLAVQAFLRMCNLDFEIVSRANAEFMSPSGKVPFIKCGAFVVSELEGIVQFVNNKGISLTTNMESEQKSDMRAYMSLVHNVLENAELYLCWCDKETYNEVTKPRNGSVYPWPLNHFQTWSKRATVCKRLKMLGWYNKTLEDVYQEVENCCQALTDRLEGKEFFFGRKFTEMDALVYGHIYSILIGVSSEKINKLASLIIHKYDKLINHCKLIHRQVMKRNCDPIMSVCSRLTIPPQEPNMTDGGQNFNSDTETDTKLPETGDAEAVVTAESGLDTDMEL